MMMPFCEIDHLVMQRTFLTVKLQLTDGSLYYTRSEMEETLTMINRHHGDLRGEPERYRLVEKQNYSLFRYIFE